MRYRVQGAETNEKGEVDIPNDARIIGVMYHPVTLKLMVACLVELPLEQQPEEEGQEEKLVEEQSRESHVD